MMIELVGLDFPGLIRLIYVASILRIMLICPKVIIRPLSPYAVRRRVVRIALFIKLLLLAVLMSLIIVLEVKIIPIVDEGPWLLDWRMLHLVYWHL